MDNETAIKVEHISKNFKLPHEKQTSVKSIFINFYRRKKSYEMQEALKDVSFEVKKGEFFGIVGRNGSGKSTLLKLLASIYAPTKGSIQVNGTLTPFIELGVGFNPELTGRENVYLNGALLGFNRKEMLAMYEDIVEFAELEQFMDQKLKNYSSGMQVRLAFSIAIRAKSDILLIDEVLAVGDAAFQQKCFEYFRVLKSQGKTVIFVSHDRAALESFCERCVLIDGGKLLAAGPTNKILVKYNEIVLEQAAGAKSKTTKAKKRWGTHDIQIIDAYTQSNGSRTDKFKPHDTINIIVKMQSNAVVEQPVYGIVIKREGEEPIFVTNTKVEGIDTGTIKEGQRIEVVYEVDNIFGNGSYSISPAVANRDATLFYDWRENFLSFYITGWDDTYISIHPHHKIKVDKLVLP